MSVQVDLGEGKFAVIKEEDELRSGDTRRVNAAFTLHADMETGELIVPGDMDDNMWRALARNVVIDWNLEHPLPSRRPDSLDKLTLGQEDALRDGLQPLLSALKRAKKAEAEGDPELDPTDSISSTSG